MNELGQLSTCNIGECDIFEHSTEVDAYRNPHLTYPYFHDGEAATLTQAVDVMGRLQLGRKFTPEENADIVAFLKTLTGDQPVIQYPVLPPSEDGTPRPEPFMK